MGDICQEHSFVDIPENQEVICELCGTEQFVGKGYWNNGR
jgi:hypothetical protein